jgi:hypothetical protein
MTTPKHAVVALYLYGDALNNQTITNSLGVTATKSWNAGARKTSKRPEGGAIAKTGVWVLRAETGSLSVADQIAELPQLTDLEGVDAAILDIYVQGTGCTDFGFEIPEKIISEIARAGLNLICSFGPIADDDNHD